MRTSSSMCMVGDVVMVVVVVVLAAVVICVTHPKIISWPHH